jgi:hypothetical protein
MGKAIGVGDMIALPRPEIRIGLIKENNTFTLWCIEQDTGEAILLYPKWAWPVGMYNEMIEEYGEAFMSSVTGLRMKMDQDDLYDLGAPMGGYLEIYSAFDRPTSILYKMRDKDVPSIGINSVAQLISLIRTVRV